MSNQKNEHGKVKIFMTKEICNSLISVLNSYIVANETNKYNIYAKKFKHWKKRLTNWNFYGSII